MLPRSRVGLTVLPTRRFGSAAVARQRPFAVSQLPQKAELELSAMGRFSKVVPPRRGRSVVQRVGSTYGGTHALSWVTPPRSVLLITKRKDAQALETAKKMVRYIREAWPELSIVVEGEVYDELRESVALIPLRPADIPLLADRVDFVIALGGDGTLLRVASLFNHGPVPPVLGVSGGSLGFMMPVHIDTFPKALADVLESRAALLLRMRLECVVTEDDKDGRGKLEHAEEEEIVPSIRAHAMNEITLHRGASSHLIYVNASVDGALLTEVVADGLLVSTPTGSSAYSLSAGGPIVHPSVQSLILTAISPRSLSFRTVMLPSDVSVKLQLSPRSRSDAHLSLDGQPSLPLRKGQSLSISMSPFPVGCFQSPTSRLPAKEGKPESEHDPWIDDIRRLRFNSHYHER